VDAGIVVWLMKGGDCLWEKILLKFMRIDGWIVANGFRKEGESL
jgi:hypothetical protein